MKVVQHSPWRSAWSVSPEVTFLNHGSFGLVPRSVQASRQEWQRRLYENPMDFFLRQMEVALEQTAQRLGKWIGAPAKDLLLVDNATVGMNLVAQNLVLAKDDEILFTNHEYGAVRRIWQKRCEQVGARVVIQNLPEPLTDPQQVADRLLSGVTSNTRLIVVSHLTSPTAVILPVAEICRQAKAARVPVCIDGPHGLAALPLNLAEIGCDYYCASAHKWLSAPNGSGFLYVAGRHQSRLGPQIVSWGGSIGGYEASWKDEFNWQGTRDPAAYFSIPAAIDFLECAGIERFRQESHALAQLARDAITELTGLEALVPDSRDWYGPMVSLPLPTQGLSAPPQGQRDPLQNRLWEEFQIEVPITWWGGFRLLRVSCHLYNTAEDITRLVTALERCLS